MKTRSVAEIIEASARPSTPVDTTRAFVESILAGIEARATRHALRVAKLESRAAQLKSTTGGLVVEKEYRVGHDMTCDCCGSTRMRKVVRLTSAAGTKLRVGHECAAMLTR